MKLAVIGSRGYTDYQKMKETLDSVRTPITMLISGGAEGADSLAQQYAKEKGLPITIFYPNRAKYGHRCYAVRNQQIIDACDNAVAFWTGGSPGTGQTIELASKVGKKVYVVLDLDGKKKVSE